MKRIVGILIALTACTRTEAHSPLREDSEGGWASLKQDSGLDFRPDVGAGARTFGAVIYDDLRHQEGNVVFSPVGIGMALGAAALGAHGATRAEFDSVLGMGDDLPGALANATRAMQGAEGGPVLRSSTRVFVKTDLEVDPRVARLVTETFEFPIATNDFGLPATSREIRTWIESQTQTPLSAPLDLAPETAAVFVNATYFKGRWQEPFSKSKTVPMPFTDDRGQTALVPMMHKTEAARCKTTDNFVAAELPYANDGARQLVFDIVVPKPGRLDATEAELTKTRWRDLDEVGPCHLNLAMPRTKVHSVPAVKAALQRAGLKIAFGVGADFRGFSAREPLIIDRVIHDATLGMDEEGTEASAATVVVAAPPMAIEVVDVNADHPYLVLVRERTSGTPLFVARISRPLDAIR